MRPYRTVLEQKIRERRMTLEEFAAYAENFAREHGEPGTLSLRHLQRLVAGKGPKGQPLGSIRPATARLLERIFELDSSELLTSPVQAIAPPNDDTAELRDRIEKSRCVDAGMLQGLRDQLNTIRRIDRQYGAIVTHNELLTKIAQIQELFTYSLTSNTRRELAVLLSEMHALAGWQSLDMGRYSASWNHYEQAKNAALETENLSFYAHATAEQAFTLIDLGDATSVVELFRLARETRQGHFPGLLKSWLAAAHGEVVAAAGNPIEALRSFDEAESLLPLDGLTYEGPYVALDINHLARWRGHATSRTAQDESLNTLKNALNNIDSTFARAETGLRVDMATAMLALDDIPGATEQSHKAHKMANCIGSARQLNRIHLLLDKLGRRQC